MVKRNSKKTKVIDFEEFEIRCKDIANLISKNKNIKNIFGVPRGGVIPAMRIAKKTLEDVCFRTTRRSRPCRAFSSSFSFVSCMNFAVSV